MATNIKQIRAELKTRFGDDMDDNLLDECVKICETHNCNGDDIFFKWEALRFNLGPSQFSTKDLEDVRKEIQKDLNKRASLNKMLARGKLSGLQSRNFASTPTKSGMRPTIGGPLPGSPMTPKTIPMVRPQDGFDMSRIEEKKVPVAGPSRVAFVGPSMNEKARKKRAYHYMYEKVSERSEVLDDRIDYFGELVKEYYNVEELGDPSAVTQEDVIVVGRITVDSESSSGPLKLNEASLVLESSRMMGSGTRIPLRFDQETKIRRGKGGMGGQGLFLGAIVALKGKNGGGGSFLASEILSLPPLEPSPSTLTKSELGDTQFSMFVACGPFTHDSDLHYRPFQNLLADLKTIKPAVVLLIGPFIDTSHTLVKSGDVDSTPSDMFSTAIIARLIEFLDDTPGSIVLLVPSVRDILSDHAVFPQPELGRELANHPSIHMLPNPARFTVNGVHFATSSVDVLFHLRKEEFFKRATEVEPLAGPADPQGQNPSDAMASLCRHVLQQRSFYPLFPVPSEVAHEVNLDVTHSELLSLSPELDDDDEHEEHEYPLDGGADPSMACCAPDVFIIPSRLKQFSKVVDNTVAINPSFLTKSTYVVVEYAGHIAPGPVKDRLNVKICRLEQSQGMNSGA